MYKVVYELFNDVDSFECQRLDGAYELCKEVARLKKYEVGVDSVTFKIYFEDELLEEITL